MSRLRFFATLHFARRIKNGDIVSRRLATKVFYHAFTVGWNDSNQSREFNCGNTE